MYKIKAESIHQKSRFFGKKYYRSPNLGLVIYNNKPCIQKKPASHSFVGGTATSAAGQYKPDEHSKQSFAEDPCVKSRYVPAGQAEATPVI